MHDEPGLVVHHDEGWSPASGPQALDALPDLRQINRPLLLMATQHGIAILLYST